MLYNGIFLQCSLYFCRQSLALPGQIRIIPNLAQHFSRLTQRCYRKKVRGNQKSENRGVIRRTERGNNHTHRIHRVSVTMQQGFTLRCRHTAELIRTIAVFTLLLDASLVNHRNRFLPSRIERRIIVRFFPIMVSQADRITERVKLPLAFVEFLLHIRIIRFPLAAGRTFVETVGIRVDKDTISLATNHALQQLLQFLIFLGQYHIRINLRRRISQPHRVDIACQDERIRTSVLHFELYGRI